MLSKRICKHCHEKAFDDKHVRYNNHVIWGLKEDKDWENGFVLCAYDDFHSLLTIDNPPERCPYLLEYLMEKQEIKNG